MKRNTIGYIIIVALLLATSVFSLALFFRHRTDSDLLDIRIFPETVGVWKGKDLDTPEYVYKMLETRNMISREYTTSGKEKLYLFIIYSETNRSVFHPPEVCMVGSGLEIVDKQTIGIKSGNKIFSTNKLHVEKKDRYKELVLCSYKAGDLYTENFYLQQACLIFHQMFGKRVPGATIRVSMPITGDEETTLAALKSFLSETVKIVDGISRS